MISNVIVNELGAQVPELKKASNLFAEVADGDQVVAVMTTSTFQTHITVEELRQSTIQILIKGWSAAAGEALAESIVPIINALNGTYTHNGTVYDVRPFTFGICQRR